MTILSCAAMSFVFVRLLLILLLVGRGIVLFIESHFRASQRSFFFSWGGGWGAGGGVWTYWSDNCRQTQLFASTAAFGRTGRTDRTERVNDRLLVGCAAPRVDAAAHERRSVGRPGRCPVPSCAGHYLLLGELRALRAKQVSCHEPSHPSVVLIPL